MPARAGSVSGHLAAARADAPPAGSIALRVQEMDLGAQTLVLAHLVAARSDEGTVSPTQVLAMFHEFGLPAPAKIGNVFASLAGKGLVARGPRRGAYKVTPKGQDLTQIGLSGLDLAALIAEGRPAAAPLLGSMAHALVPVALAPPGLISPLRRFVAEHPFDRNVLGMTRFPDARADTTDPIGAALAVARDVCAGFGLEFHLASDRAISDDLWTNVTAHMWASRYGIAFFEDRADRGLNHNLLIEVGAMVMTGRRCALLKDGSISKLPTDFVGMIYKSVDLSDAMTVGETISAWITKDLGIRKT